MIKLNNLQQISTLPITTTLQEQVKAILTEPFHDEAELNKHGMNCNVNSGSSHRNPNSLPSSSTISKG